MNTKQTPKSPERGLENHSTKAPSQGVGGYKPSGIEWLGDIPEHWEVKKVGQLFRLRIEKSGINHGKELLSVYSSIGVKPRKDMEQRGNKASTTNDYWIVKKGDIVSNKLLAWMGAIGVSHYEGVTSPAYDILMPICELNSDYFHYLFRTKLYIQQFKIRSRGILDMKLRFYFDEFKTLSIATPPIEEQNKIAQYLDYKTKQINRFIKNKQKLIKLLKEQKQNIINQAVTKGTNRNVRLKPSGVEWLGDIPEHWKHTTIRRVSKVYSGGTPSRNNLSYWENGSIPWIPSGYVNKRQIHGSEYFISNLGFTNSSAKWIPEGSLVIALAGQGKTKGMVATVEEPVTCNQSLGAIVPTNKGLNYEFLAYYLESKYRNIRGLVGDELRDGLNLEYVKSIPLPLPSLEEQKVIVKYIEKETAIIDKAIERTEREIELIKEYKTTLISEVVTGKLPPSPLLGGNLEDEEINDEEIESEENLDEELVEREEEETN